MKTFNLERALAGDPVVTRAGKPVEQLHKFEAKLSEEILFGVVDDLVKSWTKNGKYYGDDEESQYDLFMASVKREGWINISKYHNGDIRVSDHPYPSRLAALNNASVDTIDTIKIEWEE